MLTNEPCLGETDISTTTAGMSDTTRTTPTPQAMTNTIRENAPVMTPVQNPLQAMANTIRKNAPVMIPVQNHCSGADLPLTLDRVSQSSINTLKNNKTVLQNLDGKQLLKQTRLSPLQKQKINHQVPKMLIINQHLARLKQLPHLKAINQRVQIKLRINQQLRQNLS
uniref:Uncharacterized protein n=1 Tax=Cacopsylla melanoneura TaxID=428564 RepID=A0A8D8RR55_9HEMI